MKHLFRLEAKQSLERAVVDHTPLCRFTIWDFPGELYEGRVGVGVGGMMSSNSGYECSSVGGGEGGGIGVGDEGFTNEEGIGGDSSSPFRRNNYHHHHQTTDDQIFATATGHGTHICP